MRHFLLPACPLLLALLACPASANASSPARIPASVVAGSCPAPQWPHTSIRLEEILPTKVAFVIGTDGRVRKATIEQSAGHRLWDDAVIKALSACRFVPARLGGKPVAGIVTMQHIWTLD